MDLETLNRQKDSLPRGFLSKWVLAVARELERVKLSRGARAKFDDAATLRLVFVGRAEGRRLNKQFRQKDYATDVLSFESFEPGVLGELVICMPVINKQAREHGLKVTEELGYMVLHGILHLLGYDHEKSDREARQMYRLQDAIFEKLLKKPTNTSARKPTKKG